MTRWYNPLFFAKLLIKNESWLDLMALPISYQLYLIEYLFDSYVDSQKKIKLKDYIKKELGEK